jgi:hypothetical protein
MSAFIGTFLVGIVCIILGISNRKGNISSLHSYHRNRVSEEDRVPFGKQVGNGTILIGCAVLVFSVLAAAAHFTCNEVFVLIGTPIMLVGLAAGLIISFRAMIKYNGGIF